MRCRTPIFVDKVPWTCGAIPLYGELMKKTSTKKLQFTRATIACLSNDKLTAAGGTDVILDGGGSDVHTCACQTKFDSCACSVRVGC